MTPDSGAGYPSDQGRCCHIGVERNQKCIQDQCVYSLQVLTDGDRSTIEKSIEKVIKEDQRFQRVVVSREEALSMFQENKFKVRGRSGTPCRLVNGQCLSNRGFNQGRFGSQIEVSAVVWQLLPVHVEIQDPCRLHTSSG